VQPTKVVYSLEVELIQRTLIDMKYFEVGDPDGLIGRGQAHTLPDLSIPLKDPTSKWCPAGIKRVFKS